MVENHSFWGILAPRNKVMNLFEKPTQNSDTEMFLFLKVSPF